MSSEQDPAFWRNLYKAPTESEEDGESTGFYVVIDPSDLIAERASANAAVTEDADAAGAASVDPAKLAGMVDKLLKKRLAAMAAKGMLSAPAGASAPPRRRAPGEKSPMSSALASSSMAALSPEDLVAAGTQSPPSSSADSDEEMPWESDAAATAIDEELPPWQETPEEVPMGTDTQASTVTIEDAGDFDIEVEEEDDDELFVSVEDEDEFDIDIDIEDDDEDDDELTVEIDDDDEAAAGGFSEASWGKVPMLPGGQSSLIGVEGLSPVAPMVLVLVDGVSTLKGLKMLVPHVPDDEFTAIIKDGLERGLVVFE